MAESLLISIAKQLLPQLASFASQEVGLVYGVKDDVRRLEQTLSTIKAVLLDAEEKQQTNHVVKISIQRLKEVVSDADDLLEDIATENLRRKAEGEAKLRRKVYDFFSFSNQLAFCLKMDHRIKNIRGRLDEIIKDVSITGFVRKEVGVDSQAKYNWRETECFVLEPEMIGRDQDKEKIMELLLCPDAHERISVVAIVGFGGIGKTALAKLVYNDEKISNYFNWKYWVCVSKESNVEVLLKLILKVITPHNEMIRDFSFRQSVFQVRENIEGKKYLLVLDGVWNLNKINWGQLMYHLMVGGLGSKILVTTRSKGVCFEMGIEFPYELGGLTEDQSWNLFERLAFRKGQGEAYLNLVEIGKEIAKRCQGVPLAIRTLGSMMHSKNRKDEWLSILNSDTWRLVDSANCIGPILKLSYDHLPIELRQCFIYCSMFPKDYEFKKEMLTNLWIAQGYIQCSSESENESLEDIGDQYLNELSFRSFFQKYTDDYDREYYKMHDLIHDLAQPIAGDSCFIINDDVRDRDIPAERVDHVYCENSFLPSKVMLKSQSLRTLFLERNIAYDLLEKNKVAVASNCMRLRVLSAETRYGPTSGEDEDEDVSYLPIVRNESGPTKLSKSIGKLKHLRYLDLSKNPRIESLPNSICSLYNLQTLILSKCRRLRELPRDVRKLISLRHLTIDECYSLKGMPVGLGKLTSLRTLSTFIVARDEGSATLNELNSLNQLRGYLRIEGLENVKNAALESNQVNLKEKKHLHKLCLSWDDDSGNSELLLDNLHPPPNLKHLKVWSYGGVRFSSWLSSLTNLVQLDISYCPNSKHLPSLDQLPYLEHLCLSGFEVLEYISCEPFSSSSAPFFSSLKRLDIVNCPILMGWWREDADLSLLPEFPCLSKLQIESCPNLTLMPTFPSLDAELELTNASIRPLHETMKVKMMSTEVMAASSFVSAPLSKLKTLILYSIEDCSDYMATSLLEGMHQFTSLKELKISHCTQLSERCRNKMAVDWPKIAHISNIEIDWRDIQREGHYLWEEEKEE